MTRRLISTLGRSNLCKMLVLIFMLLPALAFASKEDGKLDIAPFADNVWLYHSYLETDDWGLVSSNGLVIVENGDAYVLDTPWSEKDTVDLLDWIKAQGFTPKASISTHFHPDRSAGISVLNERNIDTWASRQTNELLAQQGWAQASHEFEGDEFSSLTNWAVLQWVNGATWLPLGRTLWKIFGKWKT